MEEQSAASQMVPLKECPKCGRSNAADTRYCEGCGASLKDVEVKVVSPEKKKGLLAKLFGRES